MSHSIAMQSWQPWIRAVARPKPLLNDYDRFSNRSKTSRRRIILWAMTEAEVIQRKKSRHWRIFAKPLPRHVRKDSVKPMVL